MQIAVLVSALFFTIKRLNNDGWPSASSRLLRETGMFHTGNPANVAKSFVAQIAAASKFPAMQRNNVRGHDEIRSIDFELNVAPHASGSVLVSIGQTRVICGVTIEEAVPRWMKEQGVTGCWLTAEYSMLPYSTQTRKPFGWPLVYDCMDDLSAFPALLRVPQSGQARCYHAHP